jgi:2-amino-4-hydroxy-6-hydroxymethyldihydropteridine diphosphokinase
VTSVLSLGSNLGDRMAHLALGVQVLEPIDVSPVYETEPWGEPDQPPFLNLVVLCTWDAGEAWRRAQQAEQLAGRERTQRWGPRTLDVDVIVASGSDPALELPHPRAHQRAFVLVPWLDLDPDASLDGHGPIADLPVDRTGVTLFGELP